MSPRRTRVLPRYEHFIELGPHLGECRHCGKHVRLSALSMTSHLMHNGACNKIRERKAKRAAARRRK